VIINVHQITNPEKMSPRWPRHDTICDFVCFESHLTTQDEIRSFGNSRSWCIVGYFSTAAVNFVCVFNVGQRSAVPKISHNASR